MTDTFVGRAQELRKLAAFMERATAGHAQVVFIAGEAGAGKSSLAREFVRRAEEANADLIAATGECNAQTGAGDPYLPFRQVLSELTGADDPQRTAGQLSASNASRLKEFVRVSGETLLSVGPDLIGVFVPGASLVAKIATTVATQSGLADKLADRLGERVKPGSGVDPTLDQQRIFEQYARVLAALSRQRPLILVLDDLHWADSASLNLLFHLQRQLRESRVLIVGTYRADDVALGRLSQTTGRIERHPLEPILNEIQRYAGDIVIDLGAAQVGEGRGFVDAIVDAEPNRLDAAFRDALYARTEGHPLFTVELLRDLEERGDLAQDDTGRWTQSASFDWNTLPARVEGVIAERLARLTSEARDALTIGSVMGRDFAAQVIAHTQAAPEREVVRLLSRELDRRHNLVQETGEARIGALFLSWYRFAHVLFQRYLYDELGPGERRLLHGDVAAALESLYGDQAHLIAADLARHYEEAGQDDRAVACLIQAGDAAARAYAHTEAVDYYSRGLALCQEAAATDAQLEHLYLSRGRELELSDRYDQAVANYGEMQTLAQANHDRRLELSSLMARALAHAVGSGVWDLDKAQELALDALVVALDLRDRAAECRVYWILLLVNRFGKEGARKAVEYGERSLALARELGPKEQLAFTLKDLAVAYAVTGRFAETRATGQEAIDLWRELDNKPMLAEVLGGQVGQHMAAGALDEAVRAGEESLALNRSIGNRFGLSITATFICIAHQELGNMASAIEQANEAIAFAGEINLRSGLAWMAGVYLADIYAFMGDFGRAIEYAERAIATADPHFPARLCLPRASLAEIYLQQGKRGEAEALLAPYRDWSFLQTFETTAAICVRPTYAQAELALAQGDFQRALMLMQDMITSSDSMGMLIALPTALHLKGQALLALGRGDEARAALLEARTRAAAMRARMRLLPILLTLREFEVAAGHLAEAEAARIAAREVAGYIAERAPDELRASFLNLPSMRGLGDS